MQLVFPNDIMRDASFAEMYMRLRNARRIFFAELHMSLRIDDKHKRRYVNDSRWIERVAGPLSQIRVR